MTDFDKIQAEAAAQTEAQIAAEREAFESWQGEAFGEYRFQRDDNGFYLNFNVNIQWTAWLARAAMAGAAA